MSSGTPAMAGAGHDGQRAGDRHGGHRPDSRRMSRVPVSWSMMPTAMNSDALKVAWFSMWNTAATAASFAAQAQQQGDQAEVADGGIGQQVPGRFWNIATKAPSSRVSSAGAGDDPEPFLGAPPVAPATAAPAGNTPAWTMVAEQVGLTGVGARAMARAGNQK